MEILLGLMIPFIGTAAGAASGKCAVCGHGWAVVGIGSGVYGGAFTKSARTGQSAGISGKHVRSAFGRIAL